MRLFCVYAAILLLAESAMSAEPAKGSLAITLDTRVMLMSGLPPVPPMPGETKAKQNTDINGPAQANAVMTGRKSLSMVFTSPQVATAEAGVSISPPTGLSTPGPLDFLMFRAPKTNDPAIAKAVSSQDISVKRYWGSGQAVAAGQPQDWAAGKMTTEQLDSLKKWSSKFRTNTPDTSAPTTAKWPGGRPSAILPPESSAAGQWSLTSFAGDATIDIPASLDFLPALQMTSPDFTKPTALDAPITVNWKATSGVEGYYVSAAGLVGKQSLVVWTSGSADKLVSGTHPIADLVKATSLLASDATSATIPAGIFKGVNSLYVMVEGFGKGMITTTQPTITLTRTTTTTILIPNHRKTDNQTPDTKSAEPSK